MPVVGCDKLCSHSPITQYELSETAAILQSERSLAKCQNSWLEEMIEKKDTGNLDASNLCELVSYAPPPI